MKFNDWKSTSWYVFHMGSGAISRDSKKQPIVSLSTTKVEYVVATTTTWQAIWMRSILTNLWQRQEGTTIVYWDTNPIIVVQYFFFHKMIQHIESKHHFIREVIKNGEIILQHCRSQKRNKFVHPRNCLGIVNLDDSD